MKPKVFVAALLVSLARPPAPPPGTMMVLDVAGDGITMTTPEAGVRFDLDGDGQAEQIPWTSRGSDDAILVLDVNGNGLVDNGQEVVGRQFRLPGPWASSTGADALIHELQGFERGHPIPDGAGEIDRKDAVFERLRLWTDRDHDGRSSASELATLPASGVTLIYTGFLRPREGTPRSVDAAGNHRLFEGAFLIRQRGVDFKRTLVEYEPAR